MASLSGSDLEGNDFKKVKDNSVKASRKTKQEFIIKSAPETIQKFNKQTSNVAKKNPRSKTNIPEEALLASDRATGMPGRDEDPNLLKSKARKERAIERGASFGLLMKFPKIPTERVTKQTDQILKDPNIFSYENNESLKPSSLNNYFQRGSRFKVKTSDDRSMKLEGKLVETHDIKNFQHPPKGTFLRPEKYIAPQKIIIEKQKPFQIPRAHNITPLDSTLHMGIAKGQRKDFDTIQEKPLFTKETASASKHVRPLPHIELEKLWKSFIESQARGRSKRNRGNIILVHKGTQYEDMTEKVESNDLEKSTRIPKETSNKKKIVEEEAYAEMFDHSIAEKTEKALGKSLRTRKKLSNKNVTAKEVEVDVISKGLKSTPILFKRKPNKTTNKPIESKTSNNLMDIILRISNSIINLKTKTSNKNANLEDLDLRSDNDIKESEHPSIRSFRLKKIVIDKDVVSDKSAQRKQSRSTKPKIKYSNPTKDPPRLEFKKTSVFERAGQLNRESASWKTPLDVVPKSPIVKKHIAKYSPKQTFDSYHSKLIDSKKDAGWVLVDPSLLQSTDDRNKKAKAKKGMPSSKDAETETCFSYVRPLGPRKNLKGGQKFSTKEAYWDEHTFLMWQHGTQRTRGVRDNTPISPSVKTHKEQRIIEAVSKLITPLENIGQSSLPAKLSKERSIDLTATPKFLFENNPRNIPSQANISSAIKMNHQISQVLDIKEEINNPNNLPQLPFEKSSKKTPSNKNISIVDGPNVQETDSMEILINTTIYSQISNEKPYKTIPPTTSKELTINNPISPDPEKIVPDGTLQSKFQLPDERSLDKDLSQKLVTMKKNVEKQSPDTNISVDLISSLNINVPKELVQSLTTADSLSVDETQNLNLSSLNINFPKELVQSQTTVDSVSVDEAPSLNLVASKFPSNSSLFVERMADKAISNKTEIGETTNKNSSKTKLSNKNRFSNVFSKFRSLKDSSGKSAKLPKNKTVKKSVSKLATPIEKNSDKLDEKEDLNAEKGLGKDIYQIEPILEEDFGKPTVEYKKSTSKLSIKASDALIDMSPTVNIESTAETLNQGVVQTDDLVIKDLMADLEVNIKNRLKNSKRISKSEINLDTIEGNANPYVLTERDSMTSLWMTHDVPKPRVTL